MKIVRLFSLIALCSLCSCKYDRVKAAYAAKTALLQKELTAKNLTFPAPILLEVFKVEQEMNVWVQQKDQYQLFKTYKICKISGTLGRKRKEGDRQVPEGFYTIDQFNPRSHYHLSLRVSYPNVADTSFADKQTPGGDIFIHGNCVSAGCMAMTDDKIKEIYLLALESQLESQKTQSEITVNIYPFRMTDANLSTFAGKYPQWLTFWQNLKIGYEHFNRTHIWTKPSVLAGQYVFQNN